MTNSFEKKLAVYLYVVVSYKIVSFSEGYIKKVLKTGRRLVSSSMFIPEL